MKKMTEQKPLIQQRMVVIPLPAAFRVKSEAWQFPTLSVYTESLGLLGKTLPFSTIEDLRLEAGAIKFTVNGEEYSYAAQGCQSKEQPNLEISEKLFALLVALKAGEQDRVAVALAELKGTRKSLGKSMAVSAVLLIVLCAVLALFEEFGCN